MSKDVKDLAIKWLNFAKEDYSMAKISNENNKPLYVAFHSQQSVEKSLKGLILLLKKTSPQPIHDLLRLYNEIKTEVACNEETLNQLSSFYIIARYPTYKESVLATLSTQMQLSFLNLSTELIKCLEQKLK
jgi:HEPN domain-containing protein